MNEPLTSRLICGGVALDYLLSTHIAPHQLSDQGRSLSCPRVAIISDAIRQRRPQALTAL